MNGPLVATTKCYENELSEAGYVLKYSYLIKPIDGHCWKSGNIPPGDSEICPIIPVISNITLPIFSYDDDYITHCEGSGKLYRFKRVVKYSICLYKNVTLQISLTNIL